MRGRTGQRSGKLPRPAPSHTHAGPRPLSLEAPCAGQRGDPQSLSLCFCPGADPHVLPGLQEGRRDSAVGIILFSFLNELMIFLCVLRKEFKQANNAQHMKQVNSHAPTAAREIRGDGGDWTSGSVVLAHPPPIHRWPPASSAAGLSAQGGLRLGGLAGEAVLLGEAGTRSSSHSRLDGDGNLAPTRTHLLLSPPQTARGTQGLWVSKHVVCYGKNHPFKPTVL